MACLNFPINDSTVARDLFSAAETWAKAKGATTIIGQVDINVCDGLEMSFKRTGMKSSFHGHLITLRNIMMPRFSLVISKIKGIVQDSLMH